MSSTDNAACPSCPPADHKSAAKYHAKHPDVEAVQWFPGVDAPCFFWPPSKEHETCPQWEVLIRTAPTETISTHPETGDREIRYYGERTTISPGDRVLSFGDNWGVIVDDKTFHALYGDTPPSSPHTPS